jgi:hypothetical protein
MAIRAFSKLILPKTHAFKRGAVGKDRLTKVRKFIAKHQAAPGVLLSEDVRRVADKDKDLQDLLTQFKYDDKPKWQSILSGEQKTGMEQYVQDLAAENSKARKEDLRIHEFYRKKKVASDFHTKIMDDEDGKEESDDEDFWISPESDYGKNLHFRQVWDWEEFNMMLLYAGSTTNVTTLNRVM